MAPATPLDLAAFIVLAVAGFLVAWGLLASRHRTRR